MYLECHLFNVTNVEELLKNKTAIMKVEQLGPYVYREKHTKVSSLYWYRSNSTYSLTFTIQIMYAGYHKFGSKSQMSSLIYSSLTLTIRMEDQVSM